MPLYWTLGASGLEYDVDVGWRNRHLSEEEFSLRPKEGPARFFTLDLTPSTHRAEQPWVHFVSDARHPIKIQLSQKAKVVFAVA